MGLGPNIPSTAGPDTPTMLVLRDAPYFLGVLLRGKGLRSRLLWSDEGNMRGLRLRHCLPSHVREVTLSKILYHFIFLINSGRLNPLFSPGKKSLPFSVDSVFVHAALGPF